jgi:hypothetical protein
MACAKFFLTFLPNLIWAWKEARRWGQDNAASFLGFGVEKGRLQTGLKSVEVLSMPL